MLRTGGRSPTTIGAHLRAIIAARRWARGRGLSLEDSLRAGRLLTEREIEDLTRTLRLRQKDAFPADVVVALPRRRSGTESLRRSKGPVVDGLEPRFAGNRIRFVRDYLVWLARSSTKPDIGPEIEIMAERFAVRARSLDALPGAPPRGLEADQRASLLSLIDPQSPNNPFPHQPARIRNALIVRVLYATGVRRGELAGLKVRDIDPKASKITVHRRGDDPDDPRKDPPRAKTAARDVPCDHALIRDLGSYVLDVRRREPAARQHPFLFVGHWGPAAGAPLSTRQIGKIFETLSRALGFDVHAHLLRHTWNDRFSEVQDARAGPRTEATEERVRGVLMGWSPSSKMPARYSRRHIEKAAAEAMRAMSKGLVKDE